MKKQAVDAAIELLVGRQITSIDLVVDPEWGPDCLAVSLDNNSQIMISRDPEGNGTGVLFVTDTKGDTQVVCGQVK